MSEYALRVKNVSKKFRLYHEKRTTLYEALRGSFHRAPHYETLQTLDDVTFDVKKGESVGIIGRNGSGKTTLLRIISKIYTPDTGIVEKNGIIIPVLALGLGFHPELTAIANIYQSSILLGIDKKTISSKIDEIIKFAELEKFADTKLKNFSSGMQMRLAFSTAVQVDPDILILDEVYSVGDVNFQQKCYEVISSFKKRDKSIVIVSHDMDSVMKLCDRVIFLNKGKIQSIGDPLTVTTEYLKFMKSEQLSS